MIGNRLGIYEKAEGPSQPSWAGGAGVNYSTGVASTQETHPVRAWASPLPG